MTTPNSPSPSSAALLHAPEGVSAVHSPSPSLADLHRRLQNAFSRARAHNLCRNAAAEFAVATVTQPSSVSAPSFRLPPHPPDHVSVTPDQLCQCADADRVKALKLDVQLHLPPPSSLNSAAPSTRASPAAFPSQADLINRYKRSKTAELHNAFCTLFNNQFRPFDVNANPLPPTRQPQQPQTPLRGCKHYARNCKVKAPCCGIFVPCRLCHDECLSDDHQINRFHIDTVLCTLCLTEQSISSHCTNCHTRFAKYYCNKCNFFDNSPHRHIYHCDRCRVCRLGKGLGIDIFHCDKCDACVSIKSKPFHNCMSRALHANCPICRVYMFTSVQQVVYMRCGHTMHSKCFEQYTQSKYQCPICLKSLADMSDHFATIDRYMSSQRMPPELRKRYSSISCNDCLTKSVVPYHYIYHKCANAQCGGYNTHVLRVFDRTDSQSTSARGDVDSTMADGAVAPRSPRSESSSESSRGGGAVNGSASGRTTDSSATRQATSTSHQAGRSPASSSSSSSSAASNRSRTVAVAAVAAVASSHADDGVTGSNTATATATTTVTSSATARYLV